MRPLVGVTMGIDHRRGTHFSLRSDYVRAVEAAGALPVLLAPGRPEDAGDLLGRLHGLVLSGGGDLDPSHYGETAHETVTDVTPERDAFELALAREALLRDHPILAICRGVQTLNVAAGGTLIQDIPSSLEGADDHDPERERWELAHDVRLLPGSRLRQVLGEDTVAVNSFHHQAVKDVGRGLVANAWSVTDGVVEGVEAPGSRFVLGVQWHPESFWDKRPSFQPLFEALVEAAREPRR
jgi:putative glutamine amidotransferase